VKILVLGAGGIGGYVGGRLTQAGADVTFLVREKRKQQLEAGGLRIESVYGSATITVKAKLKSEVGPEYDLVLLTCKAYDLPDAIESVAPAIGEQTVILPLLNGIAHIEMLTKRFGAARTWGGTAKIAVQLTPEGTVRHLNDWRNITFGAQEEVQPPKVAQFQALVEKAGIEAIVSPNIRRDLWMKLTHLATVATMTSLLRANVGEIVRTGDGAAMFQEVLRTHMEVATREGYKPDQKFINYYTDLFSQADSTYEASLARDIERGGQIESDHILGFMLEKCRAHGLPDQIHRAAYVAAKAYELRRAANRLPQRA
jgi:2-dehydropantoate 2-reductase